MRFFCAKILGGIGGILIISLLGGGSVFATSEVNRSDCKDVEIIFARGSGEEVRAGSSFTEFSKDISETLSKTAPYVKYRVRDLGESVVSGSQYPAVAIDLQTAVGAVVSGASSYKLGDSIKTGVNELTEYVKTVSKKCITTKFVFVGYSQGATVVSRAIPEIEPSKVIYAATFGDPKLILPEGKTALTSSSCFSSGELSNYRANVPDCLVYTGALVRNQDLYRGYQPKNWTDKLGAWCNNNDFMCGAAVDWSNLLYGHTSYVSKGRYREAAEKIAEKIKAAISENGMGDTIASGFDNILGESSEISIPNDKWNRARAIEMVDRWFSKKDGFEVFVANYCEVAMSYNDPNVAYFENKSALAYYYTDFIRCPGIFVADYSWYKTFDETMAQLLNDFVHWIDKEPDFEIKIFENGLQGVSGFRTTPTRVTTLGKIAEKYAVKNSDENVVSGEASLYRGIIRARLADARSGAFSIKETTVTNDLMTGKDTVRLKLRLNSETNGAMILLNEVLIGVVPRAETESGEMTVTISDIDPDKENLIEIIEIDKDGYKAEKVELKRVARERKPVVLPPNTSVYKLKGRGVP